MSLFDWRPKYSINHPLIDDQHKSLFRAADELHAAMMRGSGRDVVAKTLTSLVQYTRNHFHDEEGLMQKANYPDYVSHKAEHDDFTRRVMALRQGFSDGKMAITIETMQFLRDWLESHIIGRDTLIVKHFDAAESQVRQLTTAGSGRSARP